MTTSAQASKNTSQFALHQLITDLEVTLIGDKNLSISGIATLQNARPGNIAFLANHHYKKFLEHTNASAVILAPENKPEVTPNFTMVIAKNPYYIYAKVAKYFIASEQPQRGIHPSSVIGEHCQIHPSAYIGPNCTIGNYVTIDEDVHLVANVAVDSQCHLAAKVRIDANVSLYPRTRIGRQTRISSGVVIGSPGFGFAQENGVWHEVPQLGGVVIGEQVDIGANTTIDCGALEDTVIGNGVKLDNHIQVAHNVQIGDHTVIAGCVAIAGSTTIGKHCMIGGASILNGHIHIHDGVMIAASSSVAKSIDQPGFYASTILPALKAMESHKITARINRLGELMQRVKTLETMIKLPQQEDSA